MANTMHERFPGYFRGLNDFLDREGMVKGRPRRDLRRWWSTLTPTERSLRDHLGAYNPGQDVYYRHDCGAGCELVLQPGVDELLFDLSDKEGGRVSAVHNVLYRSLTGVTKRENGFEESAPFFFERTKAARETYAQALEGVQSLFSSNLPTTNVEMTLCEQEPFAILAYYAKETVPGHPALEQPLKELLLGDAPQYELLIPVQKNISFAYRKALVRQR